MVSCQVETTGRDMLPEHHDGSPLPTEHPSNATGPNLRKPTQNRSGDKKSVQTGIHKQNISKTMFKRGLIIVSSLGLSLTSISWCALLVLHGLIWFYLV